MMRKLLLLVKNQFSSNLSTSTNMRLNNCSTGVRNVWPQKVPYTYTCREHLLYTCKEGRIGGPHFRCLVHLCHDESKLFLAFPCTLKYCTGSTKYRVSHIKPVRLTYRLIISSQIACEVAILSRKLVTLHFIGKLSAAVCSCIICCEKLVLLSCCNVLNQCLW